MGEAPQKEKQVSQSISKEANTLKSSVVYDLNKVDKQIPAVYVCGLNWDIDNIFRRLLKMQNHFENIQIVPLGKLSNINEIQSAISNSVLLSHHTTVILNADHEALSSITSAFKKHKEPWNLGNCSSNGDELWSDGSLNPGFQDSLYLNNVIQMGLQLQATPSSFFKAMDEAHYEHYRIGAFKENLKSIEPIMRDLHLFQFNCNTIKLSEFKSKIDRNPSGFLTEEALQILKYAAISPNLGFILLRGVDLEQTKESASEEYLAQVLWYIAHGIDVRIKDDPYLSENMQEYVVEHEFYDFPIAFLRSKKTNRWWMKLSNNHDDQTPFVCISCSENDYMDVFENKIPYRLIRAIERNK